MGLALKRLKHKCFLFKTYTGVGSTAHPLGWAPGLGDGGATSDWWGAVYISLYQHTEKKN